MIIKVSVGIGSNNPTNPKQMQADVQMMRMNGLGKKLNGLGCNCPDCQCNKKGVAGLANCTGSTTNNLSGLNDGGITIDISGAAIGSGLGALTGLLFGWDWKLSAAAGGVAFGVVLPSVYD